MRLASHSPFEASIMGKQIVTSCLPAWYRMCQPGIARLCFREFQLKGGRIGRKEVVGLDGEAERRVAAILSSRSFEPHSTWHPQSTSHLSTGSSDPTPRGRLHPSHRLILLVGREQNISSGIQSKKQLLAKVEKR